MRRRIKAAAAGGRSRAARGQEGDVRPARRTAGRTSGLAVVLAAALGLGAGLVPPGHGQDAGWDEEAALPSRDDYAGSRACAECHEANHERWSRDWHASALRR